MFRVGKTAADRARAARPRATEVGSASRFGSESCIGAAGGDGLHQPVGRITAPAPGFDRTQDGMPRTAAVGAWMTQGKRKGWDAGGALRRGAMHIRKPTNGYAFSSRRARRRFRSDASQLPRSGCCCPRSRSGRAVRAGASASSCRSVLPDRAHTCGSAAVVYGGGGGIGAGGDAGRCGAEAVSASSQRYFVLDEWPCGGPEAAEAIWCTALIELENEPGRGLRVPCSCCPTSLGGLLRAALGRPPELVGGRSRRGWNTFDDQERAVPRIWTRQIAAVHVMDAKVAR